MILKWYHMDQLQTVLLSGPSDGHYFRQLTVNSRDVGMGRIIGILPSVICGAQIHELPGAHAVDLPAIEPVMQASGYPMENYPAVLVIRLDGCTEVTVVTPRLALCEVTE